MATILKPSDSPEEISDLSPEVDRELLPIDLVSAPKGLQIPNPAVDAVMGTVLKRFQDAAS